MDCDRGCTRGFRRSTFWGKARVAAAVVHRAVLCVLVTAVPAALNAQQRAAAASSLVFDGVTVVDVKYGKLLPAQRVVIAGNRIQAVGGVDTVKMPKGAQVVDARGKYLIPGLWDLHVHPGRSVPFSYPLLLANGVTGIRDAGSPVPLDTLILWRREILAGTRVGPPRQLLSGQSIAGPDPGCERRATNDEPQTCVADSADARHYVDSLQAAGADMIKPRDVARELYFVIAAEARRVGIPFGGHAQGEGAVEASDSGARIIDHIFNGGLDGGGIDELCMKELPGGEVGRTWKMTIAIAYHMAGLTSLSQPRILGSVERCRAVAEQFVRNGTWWVPTWLTELFAVAGPVNMQTPRSEPILDRYKEHVRKFLSDTVFNPYSPNATGGAPAYTVNSPIADSLGFLHIAQEAGLPMLVGTDATESFNVGVAPRLFGFALHAELALLVAEGLTPLNALQSATINPAKMLHGTDSLGAVAPGKLADLVLLNADPLADITNTTTISAVVANGRYFDRATLDRLLAEAQAKAQAKAKAAPKPEP